MHGSYATGAVLEKYKYDAFGKPVIMNAAGAVLSGGAAYGNRFLFTGREYLANFGIYEYRARAYHPRLGRFTSEDRNLFVHAINRGTAPDDWSFDKSPGEAEFNLFRYCGNDPVDFVDPTGLFTFGFSEGFPSDGGAVIAGRETIQRAIDTFSGTKRGTELLRIDPGRTITISPIGSGPGQQFTGLKGNILYVNPRDPLLLDRQSRNEFAQHPGELPPATDKGRAVILGHEAGHIIKTPAGRDENHRDGHNVRDNENPIRRDLKLPERKSYGGILIDKH